MELKIIEGDICDQEVDVIVNAWNRNIIPWWLLIPQGVSGAIKRKAGFAPFRELGRKGPIRAGDAVITGPGRLRCKAIVHVAGINLFWVATEATIRNSTQNAIRLAREEGYQSIAFPLIGAGTGGRKQDRVLELMKAELAGAGFEGEVRIVRYKAGL